jgi:hypothetical protein
MARSKETKGDKGTMWLSWHSSLFREMGCEVAGGEDAGCWMLDARCWAGIDAWLKAPKNQCLSLMCSPVHMSRI